MCIWRVDNFKIYSYKYQKIGYFRQNISCWRYSERKKNAWSDCIFLFEWISGTPQIYQCQNLLHERQWNTTFSSFRMRLSSLMTKRTITHNSSSQPTKLTSCLRLLSCDERFCLITFVQSWHLKSWLQLKKRILCLMTKLRNSLDNRFVCSRICKVLLRLV